MTVSQHIASHLLGRFIGGGVKEARSSWSTVLLRMVFHLATEATNQSRPFTRHVRYVNQRPRVPQSRATNEKTEGVRYLTVGKRRLSVQRNQRVKKSRILLVRPLIYRIVKKNHSVSADRFHHSFPPSPANTQEAGRSVRVNIASHRFRIETSGFRPSALMKRDKLREAVPRRRSKDVIPYIF